MLHFNQKNNETINNESTRNTRKNFSLALTFQLRLPKQTNSTTALKSKKIMTNSPDYLTLPFEISLCWRTTTFQQDNHTSFTINQMVKSEMLVEFEILLTNNAARPTTNCVSPVSCFSKAFKRSQETILHNLSSLIFFHTTVIRLN